NTPRPAPSTLFPYTTLFRSIGEPPKQLKGYQKVFLQPGQTSLITLTLDPQAFAYWNTAQSGWAVGGGTYRILVGSSSRDIRLQGDRKSTRLNSSHEWISYAV